MAKKKRIKDITAEPVKKAARAVVDVAKGVKKGLLAPFRTNTKL